MSCLAKKKNREKNIKKTRKQTRKKPEKCANSPSLSFFVFIL